MKQNLAIDSVLVVVYAIVSLPSVTGVGFHEWVSVGLFVLFAVHVAFHVDWAIDAAKRSLVKRSRACQGNLVLDAIILVVFAMATVSGLCISGAVLPALGLYADGYYFWDPLHAVSAKALLALLLVHVVVHGRWLVGFFKNGKGERHGK